MGGIAALKRHGLKDENAVVHARYERNTLAIENALANILFASPPPRAVIMVGAYARCAKFITLAKESGMEAAVSQCLIRRKRFACPRVGEQSSARHCHPGCASPTRKGPAYCEGVP